MNIIRICPVYFPHFKHGGAVVADFGIDKALVLQGHTVTVVTCKEKSSQPDVKVISERHKVIYFSSIGSIIYGISFRIFFWLIRQAIMAKRETDLVWFGGVWNLLTIFCPLICRLFSVKYIITTHGMLVPHLISLKSKRKKDFVIKFFLRKNLTKAYKVHFTVKKEFEDTMHAVKVYMRPVIFPLCFDLSRFNTDPQKIGVNAYSDKITLSFIGRITLKKRIDLIFAALKALPEDVKGKVRFHIVGPDDEGLWDQENYTEENIGVEISYFGTLHGNELIAAYHECDIFILCSESENFAISVVEAAYSYCAPLITKDVGVSEYFLNSSAIYSSRNVPQISQTIEFLLNHINIVEDVKMAARKVSEQFDSSTKNDRYFSDLLM